MPRPVIPKPGYSLLRLHNSQSPHLVANLSHTAKTTLINSIAQDIEGCIWAIGQYLRIGILDTANTFEFDQIIKDIHRAERREMLDRLRQLTAESLRLEKRARTWKLKLKRLREKRRQHSDRRNRSAGQKDRFDSRKSDDACFKTDSVQAVPSSQKTDDITDGSGDGLAHVDGVSAYVTSEAGLDQENALADESGKDSFVVSLRKTDAPCS